jgi:hypothetical protein
VRTRGSEITQLFFEPFESAPQRLVLTRSIQGDRREDEREEQEQPHAVASTLTRASVAGTSEMLSRHRLELSRC